MVVDVGKRKVDRIDHVAFDILAEAVTDMLLQTDRQFVVAGAGGDDAVGQAGRQHRECLDDGLGAAEHIADRGVLHLGFNISLQFLLRLGLGILEQLRVEAGRPAFRFVDGTAADEVLRQLLGIDAADGDGIQAGLVLVLFVAGIQAGPAVGSLVFGAARRVEVNRRFDPDMLEADFADDAAGDNGSDRYAVCCELLARTHLTGYAHSANCYPSQSDEQNTK